MEKRKIQSTAGGATSIVSLPKSWVKSNSLKAGDSVGMIPQKRGMLFILPNPERKKKKISEIDASGKEIPFIQRLIISEYLRGADIIRFRNADFTWKQKKAIRDFIQNAIMGLDLSEEKDTFEIRSNIDLFNFDTGKMISRLHELIHWMFANSIASIVSRDRELLLEIISRDIEVDRLTLLASRQLHLAAKNPAFAEQMGIIPHETLYYKILAEDLESAGDCAVSIARASIRLTESEIPKDITDALDRLFRTLEKNLDYVSESLSTHDLIMANTIIEDCMNLTATSFSATEKSRYMLDPRLSKDPEAVGSLAIILENLARINSIIRSLAETVLNLSRSDTKPQN